MPTSLSHAVVTITTDKDDTGFTYLPKAWSPIREKTEMHKALLDYLQRLKELKQREFARNVASKSWKDEKKQEKALRRLHQLAELRKQSECDIHTYLTTVCIYSLSGSGPMFRTTTVAVQKQSKKEIFTYSEETGKGSPNIPTCDGDAPPSSTSEKKWFSENGDKFCSEKRSTRRFSDNSIISQRAGVSFCFSKKAQLRLESSASVFSDNNEEANEGLGHGACKGIQHAEGFKAHLFSGEDIITNVQESTKFTQDHVDSVTASNISVDIKITEEDTKKEVLETHLLSCTPKSMFPVVIVTKSAEENFLEENLNDGENYQETSPSHLHQSDLLALQEDSLQETKPNSTVHPTEVSIQESDKSKHSAGVNCNPGQLKTDKYLERTAEGNTVTEAVITKASDFEYKSKMSPFLNVLSKDGTTTLQWPSELLLFTKSEPCISYSCNPLYFDFKLSKKNKAKELKIPEESDDHYFTMHTVDSEDKGVDIANSENSPEKQMLCENDNQTHAPKKAKIHKDSKKSQRKYELDKGDKESSLHMQKEDLINQAENTLEESGCFDVSQKDCKKKKSHTRKRKRPLKDHSSNESNGNERNSISSLKSSSKKSKTSNHNPFSYSEGESESQSSCKLSKKNLEYNPNDMSDRKSYRKSSSNTSDTLSGSSECEAETDEPSCEMYWRSSLSQRSSQGSSSYRYSSYSGDSASSLRTSYNGSYPSDIYSDSSSGSYLHHCPKTNCKSDEEYKNGHKWKKHKYSSFSDDNDGDDDDDDDDDNGDDYQRQTSHRSRSRSRDKSRTRNGKHMRMQTCCESGKSHSRSRTKYRRKSRWSSSRSYSSSNRNSSSESSHTRQTSSSERSSMTMPRHRNSRSFSRDRVYCLNNSREGIRESKNHNDFTKEERTKSQNYSQDIRSFLKHFANGSSGQSLKELTMEAKKLTTAKQLLEKVQSKKLEEKTSASEDCSPCSNRYAGKVRDFSQGYSGLELSPSIGISLTLPLIGKLPAVRKGTLKRDEISTLGSMDNKDKNEKSNMNDVTPCVNQYNNSLSKDIFKTEVECKSMHTEVKTAVDEQSNMLINYIPPHIQDCKPVPKDFPGTFPYEGYAVVTDSKETKEGQFYDSVMNLTPSEGTLDSYAMQNNEDPEHRLKERTKSISPPLAEQPITFTPDEIDKYRLLQLQAQQHMQQQILNKHVKVLPTPGAPPIATTPGIQPVPVQQHATVTTIHHSLLQRYAFSAAFHPPGNHQPVTHVYPLSHSNLTPISFSALPQTIVPAHPTALLAGHPFHLISAAAIHPAHLSLHPMSHAALFPTVLTRHPAAAAAALHLPPILHPVFPGQSLLHHSGPSA
nr:PREDICTED: zinc finger protein 804B-like [Latimeria chalumnae]|eukprot:XP_005999417.2 PREDICTED: zinc finger protein 804B-like [Latimeria chalumnae]